MNKSLLIEYIERIINLNMKDNVNYMEVSESLDAINENKYLEFKNFMAEQKENTKYNYSTPFQKYIGIFADFNKKLIALSPKEQTQTYLWIEALYTKLTWYFDELAWLMPTDAELERQIWKTHQHKGKNLFSVKELIVCDKLGETRELYRLATKCKPQLKEDIEKIVNELIKKSKTLAIENKNVKRLN